MVQIFRVSEIRCSAGVLLLVLSSVAVVSAGALTTDGLSLLAFKSAVSDDPTGALKNWIDTDSDPCNWRGIACHRGRVTILALPNCSLAGYLPSELSLLSSLQSLSLPRNRISGPIPAAALAALFSLAAVDLSFNNLSGPIPPSIAALRSLSALDLSSNRLSGPIPASIGGIYALSRLDLSSNLLNGSIPPSIASLPKLTGVLNLSSNLLSGEIPVAFGSIPVAVSLDLRLNNLSGEIPPVGSLLNQGPTAFAGNPNLCGFPLKNQCSPPPKQDPMVPLLNPSFNPGSPVPVVTETRRSAAVAIPLLVGVLIVTAVSVALVQRQLRRRSAGIGKGKGGASTAEEDWIEGRSGEVFVAVDEGFELELEELLRASAYVLGKGGMGIVYKVVVGSGAAVAVRRLGEGGGGEGQRHRDFASEAESIGRLRHPNVVRLRAYYWAPDEKLLITDFIANGNLAAALRGRSGQPTLSWSIRLGIAKGAARGLAYLHDCSPRKLVHGAVKPSNILLDIDYNPFISDFGLTRLINIAGISDTSSSSLGFIGAALPVSKHPPIERPNNYRAPEARLPGARPAQKWDVYSLGVVMLELLTGKPPELSSPSSSSPVSVEPELVKWVRKGFDDANPLSEMVDPALLREVYAKKEVLSVFHVALACTELDPESRPRMKVVFENLDGIGR